MWINLLFGVGFIAMFVLNIFLRRAVKRLAAAHVDVKAKHDRLLATIAQLEANRRGVGSLGPRTHIERLG